MNPIAFTLITIAAMVAIAWAIKKIVETIYNIKALRDTNADITKQKHGIVYNKDTKLLESDQAIITPF